MSRVGPSLQRGGTFTLRSEHAAATRPVTVERLEVRASGETAIATLGASAEQTRPQDLASRLRSDSPLVATRARVRPVVVEREVSSASAPGVTEKLLTSLRSRLAAGDRAGVYLELYRATGQPIWLMHAQITSYTGVFGGAALAANALAKAHNPDKYHVALDTFSRQIVASMLDVVERDVRSGGRGQVDVATLRKEGDWAVWSSKHMGGEFPGNALFMELWHHGLEGLAHVFSKGTQYGIEAVLTGVEHGKRPSEFARNPRFSRHDSEGGRFVTVIDKKTGKVEAFFDHEAKVAGMFGQIADVPLMRADAAWRSRAALWEYLQANQDVEQRFDARTVGEGRALPARYREAALFER